MSDLVCPCSGCEFFGPSQLRSGQYLDKSYERQLAGPVLVARNSSWDKPNCDADERRMEGVANRPEHCCQLPPIVKCGFDRHLLSNKFIQHTAVELHRFPDASDS